MKLKFDLERYLPYIIIAAVTFFVFSPCLFADFLNWDDTSHLLNNPFLPLHRFNAVIRIFLSPDTANRTYIPLTVFSFGIEQWLFGLNSFVFHLNNIFLHILAASLVYVLARRMNISSKGALFAALVFAVHPMRVESVAWVTERKDMLFGACYLGALIAYWDYLRSGKGKYYITALACAVLSILAKPMALGLPLVLFLFDRMSGRKFTTGVWLDKLPFVLALWPIAIITTLMNARELITGPWEKCLIAAYSATFYIIQFFLPFGSAVIHPAPRPVSLLHPQYLTGVLVFVLIVCWVWRWRKDRWVMFAILFYIFSMFFVWSVDLYEGAKGLVKERFMYVPCIGFTLLFGAMWDKYFKGAVKGVVLAGILIALLAGITFNRCFVWQDSFVFWSDVLKNDKDNTFALINRAACLIEDKKIRLRYGMSERSAYKMALVDLQKAVHRAPRDEDAWKNLSIVYRRLGQEQESIAAFDRYEQVLLLNGSGASLGKK